MSELLDHTIVGGKKPCSTCRVVKPVEGFAHYHAAKSGYTYDCLECLAVKRQEQYLKHRHKNLERGRAYRATHGNPSAKRYAESNPLLMKYRWFAFKSRKEGTPVLSFTEYSEFMASPRVCHYCGVTGEQLYLMPQLKGIRKSLTIDRRDNTIRGYILSNMVRACYVCNSVKMDFLTEQDMLEVGVKYIYPRYKLMMETV